MNHHLPAGKEISVQMESLGTLKPVNVRRTRVAQQYCVQVAFKWIPKLVNALMNMNHHLPAGKEISVQMECQETLTPVNALINYHLSAQQDSVQMECQETLTLVNALINYHPSAQQVSV